MCGHSHAIPVLLLTAIVLTAPACRKRPGPDPAPTRGQSMRPAPPKAAPREDPRFHCARDADCRVTCALGAVTRTWWKAHGARYAGCDDGCAGNGYHARCVRHACVTFRRVNGNTHRVDACTFRALPRPRPRPPAVPARRRPDAPAPGDSP